jgi:Lon protease-like protein
MAEGDAGFALPLLPLQSVLFPGGLLSVKVFEPRLIDLVVRRLREGLPVGVVARRPAGDGPESAPLENVGCIAELSDVDEPRSGVCQMRGHGVQRFSTIKLHRQDDGLWIAQARLLPADPPIPPSERLIGSARALASAIGSLREQGQTPFREPYRFGEAGWLANRWCEILPIPLAAKQRLMELPDPLVRLQLVDDFLHSKGVLK